MKTFKKVFRVLILTFIIALAAAGAGMLGVFSPQRERYMDKVITIEQIDKKREEKGDEEDEEKE